MKPLFLFFFLLTSTVLVQAQTQSPDQYLGYPLGSRFTSHHQVVSYFNHVAAQHPEIKLINYGKAYEGRQLMVAVISAKENMSRLEEIRTNNLALSKATNKHIDLSKQPALLWLSYNVHGNEASSTETAMKMIYTLATATTADVQTYLRNTVVIIDPCLNPDGRDRYVQHYLSVAGLTPDPNPASREHQEPWPRGRSNHYYFDLNRDWAWQTQVETRARMALYQDWMPEVHVDFHEQSYNDPYYFAPAAEPVHENVSQWQRDFQVSIGKNNAKYFDAEGWQYFTKERFDLLYPSYGDTYPLYNGAIGMTYEQGGIGAGLAVMTADGELLTLKDRIDHHFATGMATLETVSKQSGRLITEFKKYFEQSVSNPPGLYRSYVVKGTELSRVKKLASLLRDNQIEFSYGGDKQLSGFSFDMRKKARFKLERNDLIINLHQPKAVLANVLFEPNTHVTDSNTYDITAWAMPYAYGLEAYALKESIKGAHSTLAEEKTPANTITNPYAWVFPWNAMEDAKMLIALQREHIKVRIAEEAFTSGGTSHPAGSLLVYRKENTRGNEPLVNRLQQLAAQFDKPLRALESGFVEKGKDLGSSVYPVLKQPKVALVTGPETASGAVGEIWNFFEQELQYPVTLIGVQNLEQLNIAQTNVLILPDGRYPANIHEQLSDWVSQGGKLILMEDAIAAVAGKKPFHIKLKELPDAEKAPMRSYADKSKDNLDQAIPGAIYKVKLDRTHPLTLGLSRYYTLVTDGRIYEPLSEGWNVGLLEPGSYVTGIAGKDIQKHLSAGMLYGVQPMGKGQVVYLGTNVLFRLFWESGKQLFVNSVFIVN